MSATAKQYKEYKLILRTFSSQFGVDQKVTQRAIEQLLAFGISQPNQQFTTDQILEVAKDPASIFHDLIDWTKSVANQKKQVDAFLSMIPMFIASNNNVYSIGIV